MCASSCLLGRSTLKLMHVFQHTRDVSVDNNKKNFNPFDERSLFLFSHKANASRARGFGPRPTEGVDASRRARERAKYARVVVKKEKTFHRIFFLPPPSPPPPFFVFCRTTIPVSCSTPRSRLYCVYYFSICEVRNRRPAKLSYTSTAIAR